MKPKFLAILFVLLAAGVALSQGPGRLKKPPFPGMADPADPGDPGRAGKPPSGAYPKARVSFNDFKGLVTEVENHRASRVIDLNTFLKMSKEPGVIILDSRSAFRFDRIHVKGAKHLAFTDFTQDNLAKIIPALDTTILIYCNNNFDGNQTDFASKVAAPRPKTNKEIQSQVAAQSKPLMMALNIPTYINLYGYGYHDVYELGELVKVADPRIEFEGSIVEQKNATPQEK